MQAHTQDAPRGMGNGQFREGDASRQAVRGVASGVAGCWLLLAAAAVAAPQQEAFLGEARVEGRLAYTERHVAQYDAAGRVLRASTEYFNPAGTLIARLDSDFAPSLTAPNYTFEDFRFRQRHGIRRVQGQLLMFSQNGDEPERTRVVPAPSDQRTLVVGGQGLAYYCRAHLPSVKSRQQTALQFLIPGSLDEYDFRLSYRQTDARRMASLDLEIDSWTLRWFAPRLEMKFDESTGRLAYYKGLSNLFDDRRETQTVEITYRYPQAVATR